MADVLCNCPHCNAQVTIDDAWAGQQLQCPACQQVFVAPGAEAPAAAPQRPMPSPNVPGRGTQRQMPPPKSDDGSGAQKYVIIGMIVVVLGVGGFIVFKYGGKWQKAFSEKADKDAREGSADGGQVGHIANVYDALDATDPDKGFMTSRDRAEIGKMHPGEDEKEMPEEKEAPVVPPTWSLDVEAAKIPGGRVNGAISGAKFVYDAAQLDVVGNAVVLSLRQGDDVVPAREILVYLRPKAGEKIGGGSWSIAKDTKGAPQVAKRWQPDPRYAPTVKSYTTGYAMKLELGPIRSGEVKGKIFISLPDTEQTVAGGSFTAETSLPDTPVAAAGPAKQ